MSADRLYENGPTVEDITTTPSAWHVPEHLRDAYLDAAANITHDQITEADRSSRPAEANTWLIQVRQVARHLAGEPPLNPFDANTTNGLHGWPTGVTVRGYVLHILLLDAAAKATNLARNRERATAEWEATHTCLVCDTLDATVSKGWCDRCANARLAVFLDDIHDAAAEKVGRKTRAALVRDYLTHRPDRAGNLYEVVMRTPHEG